MTKMTKILMMMACLWAMSACGPMVRSVNSGSGVADADLYKSPCRDEPGALPGAQMISFSPWQQSKGACGPDTGYTFPASAFPQGTGSGAAAGALSIKLNHLVAGVRAGETILAFVDYRGAKMGMRVDQAAKFYTVEKPFDQVSSAEFPKRWIGELPIPAEAVGAERSIELLIRCELPPCTIGRFGFLRKPASPPAPSPPAR